MKHLAIALAAIVGCASGGRGEAQRFPISLRATLDGDTHRLKISDQNVVTTPGNRLVMAIDLQTYSVTIEEWNDDLTVRVDRDRALSGTQVVLENFRMAQVDGRKLMVDLEMVDVDWNNDGTRDHAGTLQLAADLKQDRQSGALRGLSASLLGVLSEPGTDGHGGENISFKGKIKSIGPAF